jgi:dTDP-4-dehydrorhamnose reductase
MRLLVTGGSGYLGAAILKRAPQDWELAATYYAHPLAQSHVAAFRVDVRDADAVSRLFSTFRPAVVIHTAAAMSGEAMLATNAAGTRNVARAAADIRARLIHLSSDVIFDGEHAPYDESAPPHPLTPYAESKARAERAVIEKYPAAAIVRTSLIYGFDPLDPRTRQTLAGEFPRLFTDEYRCPVFVDDLADALIELAGQKPVFSAPPLRSGVLCKKTGFSVLNLAGAQRVSRYEFGVKLARAFGVPPRFEPALTASYPTPRPRDCTLDVSLAQKILRTRLRGVDQVLAEVKRPSE